MPPELLPVHPAFFAMTGAFKFRLAATCSRSSRVKPREAEEPRFGAAGVAEDLGALVPPRDLERLAEIERPRPRPGKRKVRRPRTAMPGSIQILP